MNDERRKQPRKSFELRVPFSISRLDDMESGKIFFYGHTSDISATGLCITTDRPLEPGQVLTFGSQRLTGTVRWCKKLDQNYKFGIKFI
jgi:hypothetical protein